MQEERGERKGRLEGLTTTTLSKRKPQNKPCKYLDYIIVQLLFFSPKQPNLSLLYYYTAVVIIEFAFPT